MRAADPVVGYVGRPLPGARAPSGPDGPAAGPGRDQDDDQPEHRDKGLQEHPGPEGVGPGGVARLQQGEVEVDRPPAVGVLQLLGDRDPPLDDLRLDVGAVPPAHCRQGAHVEPSQRRGSLGLEALGGLGTQDRRGEELVHVGAAVAQRRQERRSGYGFLLLE